MADSHQRLPPDAGRSSPHSHQLPLSDLPDELICLCVDEVGGHNVLARASTLLSFMSCAKAMHDLAYPALRSTLDALRAEVETIITFRGASCSYIPHERTLNNFLWYLVGTHSVW
jgi:hypothetical protein